MDFYCPKKLTKGNMSANDENKRDSHCVNTPVQELGCKAKSRAFILIPIIQVICAILLPLPFLIALSIISIIINLLVDKNNLMRLFRLLRKPAIWILLAILLFINPMITGIKDIALFGMEFSSDTIVRGVKLVLRGIIIMSAFALMKKYYGMNIKKLWEKVGITEFEAVYSESQKVFPAIKDSFSKTLLNIINTGIKNARPMDMAANALADIISEGSKYMNNKDKKK
jgi:hypothetical protein